MSLNADLAASPPQRHRDLIAALRDQLGDLVTIDPDGTIHLKEAAA